MRKQLMTGVAAAAICLGLASCSRYDFTPISEGEQAYVNYENAFIEKFGEPAPDQTWGFGSADANGGGVAQGAITRAASRAIPFPSDAASEKFLSNVPNGVEYYGNINNGGGYANGISYIDGNISSINIWGGWDGSQTTGGTLYITGTVDFTSGSYYVAPNTEIYLVSGSTLKLTESQAQNLQKGCKYYIASGATLKVNGEIKLNSCEIYNHGTIEATKLSPNEISLLYNVGTLTLSDAITLNNADSKIVNDGTITAASLWTAGSAKFQNNGDATISGATTVNSNDNVWVNNGNYTTGTFTYEAGSSEVVNNCKMKVNGQFYINLGDNAGQNGFRMDAGASCEADTYLAKGPHNIYMGAGALFKVNGTATMDATKANYGVYGPTSGGYAVFQAQNIVAGTAEQGYEITYGNNLYVVANTHFAQGYSGDYPFIDFKGGCSESNIFTEGNMPNYSITRSECNPGFGGKPEPEAIRIIAEDLSASEGSDFDFNDVVFDVQLNWPSEGKHTITLQAAGGTLPLTIAGVEVHAKFGVSTNKMVNTESWTEQRAPVTFVIEGKYANANEIEVRVQKGSDWPLLTAPIGKAASKIAVSTDYEWVKELQDITNAYRQFDTYVTTGKPAKWWESDKNDTYIYNAQ
ncbi:MAG: hypothetical protein PUI49_06330 [Prevotellaceae bacterium]|nr:hypothetical protein [Prevotellaceae bacterium]MDY5209426.1 hypothetical protein [Prevotella sp.]